MLNRTDFRRQRAFFQHGFRPEKEIGEGESRHIIGNCPFPDCCKEEHFYVNVSSNMWDCKKCGRSGGFQTFIDELASACSDFFSSSEGSVYRENLSDRRSLDPETLTKFRVGYNTSSGRYVLPHAGTNGHLSDLRIYNPERKGLFTTQSMKALLYNHKALRESCADGSIINTIWICEGEWDTMTLSEIIDKTKSETDLAVGLPGATQFKPTDVVLFSRKRVRLVLDNDDAGRQGILKTLKLLVKAVPIDRIEVVNWGSSRKKGFDLSDFYQEYKCNARRTFRKLKDSLLPAKSFIDDDSIIATQTETLETGEATNEALDGERVPIDELHEVFTRWLLLPNTDVIDVVFGTLLANRIEGEAVWLHLIGRPGSAKSQIIMAISDCPKVYAITSFERTGIVSGMKTGSGDISMLPELDGNVMAIKDLTTILGKHQTVTEEVFSVLRDAYDGEYRHRFGNEGFTRKYKVHFGIITGVTPVIENEAEQRASLGERFIHYYINIPPAMDYKIAKRAVANAVHRNLMKDELHDISFKTLKHDYNNSIGIPIITEEIADKVIRLSEFVARCRANVERDKYSKSVTQVPFWELATRLTQELTKLCMGIAQLYGDQEVTDVHYSKVRDCGMYTIPSKVRRLLFGIWKNIKTRRSQSIPDETIVKLVDLSKDVSLRVADDMYYVGLMDYTKEGGIRRWKLSKLAKNYMRKSGF
jgi:hypothetical protein